MGLGDGDNCGCRSLDTARSVVPSGDIGTDGRRGSDGRVELGVEVALAAVGVHEFLHVELEHLPFELRRGRLVGVADGVVT